MASTQSVILWSGDLHTSWLGSVGEEIRIPINTRNEWKNINTTEGFFVSFKNALILANGLESII